MLRVIYASASFAIKEATLSMHASFARFPPSTSGTWTKFAAATARPSALWIKQLKSVDTAAPSADCAYEIAGMATEGARREIRSIKEMRRLENIRYVLSVEYTAGFF